MLCVVSSDGDSEFHSEAGIGGEDGPDAALGTESVIAAMEDPVTLLVDTAAAVHQDVLGRGPSSRKRRLVATESAPVPEAAV